MLASSSPGVDSSEGVCVPLGVAPGVSDGPLSVGVVSVGVVPEGVVSVGVVSVGVVCSGVVSVGVVPSRQWSSFWPPNLPCSWHSPPCSGCGSSLHSAVLFPCSQPTGN